MEADPEPICGAIAPFLFVAQNTSHLLIGVGVSLLLLACSGLLSAAESAFFAITHTDVRQRADSQSVPMQRVLRLLERPRYLLSTILIANNVANIAVILLLSGTLEPYLIGVGSGFWAWALIFGVVGFVVVLFGEVMPKLYASLRPLPLAMRLSGLLIVLRALLYPFSWLLVNSTQLIERRWRARLPQDHNPDESSRKTELEQAIELTVGQGKYAKQDIALLKGIVHLGNISVRHIMRSRMEVVALSDEANFSEVLALFRDSACSRIPVFTETLDQITGILHSKDLIEHLHAPDDFRWQDLQRPAFFVPENKTINDLFTDFQEKHMHMAIVVNEFGETQGLATLEDVLEEVVGDIQDEFDQPEEVAYTKLSDSEYVFEGSTSLYDVCQVTGLPPERLEEARGNAETIAGLVLSISGVIPPVNTPVSFENLRFTVLAASNRRIERIQLTINAPNHHHAENPLDLAH